MSLWLKMRMTEFVVEDEDEDEDELVAEPVIDEPVAENEEEPRAEDEDGTRSEVPIWH